MSLSRPLQGTAGPTLKGLKGAEFSSVVVLRAQVELGGSQGPTLLSERPEPGCLGSVLRWAQAGLAPPEPWFSPGTGLLREAARGPTRQALLRLWNSSWTVGPGSLACRTRGWAGPAVSGYGPRHHPHLSGKFRVRGGCWNCDEEPGFGPSPTVGRLPAAGEFACLSLFICAMG